MSELRDSIREWLKLHGRGEDYEYHAFHISELEAFAKEQRLKGMEAGMEAAKGIFYIRNISHLSFPELIDAEIKKLKDGG